MDTQPQETAQEKAGFKLIEALKSLLKKLLIIGVLAGGGYWLYIHPEVLDKVKSLQNTKTEENETLNAQLTFMQNQIDALQAELSAQPQIDLSVFEDKVSSLEKQSLNVIDSKADAAIVLGMLTRVDKLENRLDKLAKISDDGALILSAAMLVKEAAAEGHDFVYEAEILNQLSEPFPAIKKDVSVIAEYSRNGVVSKRELIRAFDKIYAEQTGPKSDEDGADWKERLNNKINEYIKINKTDNAALVKEDMRQISEIYNVVNDGQIAKAIKLIESSDSNDIKQNQLLQGWLADAQNTVTFNRAIRNIAAYSLAEMKVNNLKNKE